MKTFKFLVILLMTLVPLCIKAQTEGTYYLYNEEAGVFMSRGAHWGTYATCDNAGIPFNLKASGNYYNLEALDYSGRGFGSDFYTDNATLCNVVLTSTGDGYIIKANGVYLEKTAAHGEIVGTNSITEAASWKLVDKDEHAEILATKVKEMKERTGGDLVENNPNNYISFNKTSLLKNPMLTSLTGWTVDKTYASVNSPSTNSTYGTEYYQGSGALKQTIKNLQPGLYKVSAQGFYRDCSNANEFAMKNAGYSVSTMYLCANGEESFFPTRAEYATSQDYPNYMSEFYAMANNDAKNYLTEAYCIVKEDGVLDISINVPSKNIDSWAIVRNVKLEYIVESSPSAVISSGQCGEKVNYNLTADGTLHITGNGKMADYSSASARPYNEYCDVVKNVVIDKDVTYIGKYAFNGFKSVNTIVIPYTVESIAEYAFTNTAINSLTVGSGVLNIGYQRDFTIQKTIWQSNVVPSGYDYLQGIVNYAPNDQYSFENKTVYKNLSSLFTVDGVTYAPISAKDKTCDIIDCEYDSTVEKLTIGETVTINNYTFKILEIKESAFIGNSFIKEVDIKNDGNIGNKAFYGCSSVESAIINNNGAIGSQAFYNCSNLKTLQISNNGGIGNNAFAKCGTECVATINNKGLIDENVFENSSFSTLEIGTGVTDIFKNAFLNSRILTSATIENSGIIDESAFRKNTGNMKLIISNKGNINNYAFAEISNIESLLVNNKGKIGQYAFYKSNGGQSVRIENDGNIEKYAFAGFLNIDNLRISNNGIIDENAFDGSSISTMLDITNKGNINKNAFCNITGQFETTVNNTGMIGNSAFSNCQSMTSVQIGDNVTLIGDYAFHKCIALKSVIVGNNVTAITNRAFEECSSLESVQGGKSLISIGEYIFNKCSNLTKLTHIPNLQTIGQCAFLNCTSLPEFVIPDSTRTIGYNCFENCTSLAKVKIGKSLSELKERTFKNCSSLANLIIPNNVNTIANYVFEGCTSLATLTIKDREIELSLS